MTMEKSELTVAWKNDTCALENILEYLVVWLMNIYQEKQKRVLQKKKKSLPWGKHEQCPPVPSTDQITSLALKFP